VVPRDGMTFAEMVKAVGGIAFDTLWPPLAFKNKTNDNEENAINVYLHCQNFICKILTKGGFLCYAIY